MTLPKASLSRFEMSRNRLLSKPALLASSFLPMSSSPRPYRYRDSHQCHQAWLQEQVHRTNLDARLGGGEGLELVIGDDGEAPAREDIILNRPLPRSLADSGALRAASKAASSSLLRAGQASLSISPSIKP